MSTANLQQAAPTPGSMAVAISGNGQPNKAEPEKPTTASAAATTEKKAPTTTNIGKQVKWKVGGRSMEGNAKEKQNGGPRSAMPDEMRRRVLAAHRIEQMQLPESTVTIQGIPTIQESITSNKLFETIDPTPTVQNLTAQIAYDRLVSSQTFAIFKDVLMGRDIPVKDLPCVVGRGRARNHSIFNVQEAISCQSKASLNCDRKFVSAVNYFNNADMEMQLKGNTDPHAETNSHLGLTKCRAMAVNQFQIRYNSESQSFELNLIEKNSQLYLNQRVISFTDQTQWVPLKHMDDLRLYCDRSCGAPGHVWRFVQCDSGRPAPPKSKKEPHEASSKPDQKDSASAAPVITEIDQKLNILMPKEQQNQYLATQQDQPDKVVHQGDYDPLGAERLPSFLKDAIITKYQQFFAEGELEYVKLYRNYHFSNAPKSILMHPHLIPQNCPSLLRRYPSIALQTSWTSLEKETLKKYLLQMGYGRWNKIRKLSAVHDKILIKKSNEEMTAFSNDFIRSLYDNLDVEKSGDLRAFLINLISGEDTRGANYVRSSAKEWSDRIAHGAIPWAKRLYLLNRVKSLIKMYKESKKKFLQEAVPPEEASSPEKREKREKLKQAYETWDNLLNFMPITFFYGQRPSGWWTLRHDIDLLYGTYKYGYALYTQMRQDQSLSFFKTEQVESVYQEFPNADNITRRLKKLVQIISRSEFQAGQGIQFDCEAGAGEKETTGLDLLEKEALCEVMCDIGVMQGQATSLDGKEDLAQIRKELGRRLEILKTKQAERTKEEAANSKQREREAKDEDEDEQIMEAPAPENGPAKDNETEVCSDGKNEGQASQANNAKENASSIPATGANAELLTSIPLIMPQQQTENDRLQQEKNLLQNIERFILRIRMVAQQVIQFRNLQREKHAEKKQALKKKLEESSKKKEEEEKEENESAAVAVVPSKGIIKLNLGEEASDQMVNSATKIKSNTGQPLSLQVIIPPAATASAEHKEEDQDKTKQDQEMKDEEQQVSEVASQVSYEEFHFDPDEDGFKFSYEMALKLHRNVNMLQFIRRTLGITPNVGKKEKEPKAFNQCVDALGTKLKAPFDPENWNAKKHDLALLRILSAKGFDSTTLEAMKENDNFADIKFDDVDEADANVKIYDRITDLCNTCRDELLGKGGISGGQRRPAKNIATADGIIQIGGANPGASNKLGASASILHSSKKDDANNQLDDDGVVAELSKHSGLQKMQKTGDNGTGKLINKNEDGQGGPHTNHSSNQAAAPGEVTHTKKKTVKNLLKKDSNGDIIYPIVVNNSLMIQSLGKIDYVRPNYHTEKNLFPIGFKSIREQNSMMNQGGRCHYVCEILDGGHKPLYRVTPMDDQSNPITRDSSTGCWIEICKRINQQSGSKRINVTVSGPERFGLADSNVIRMLQQLPDAEKCAKYQMRN